MNKDGSGGSTGAKTPAGRARTAAANQRHGAYGTGMRGLLKLMRALRAQAERLVAEHNGRQRHKRRSAANPSTPTDGDPSNGR